MTDPRETLSRALSATKVAIFGASDKPEKWGHVLVRRLLEQGYGGELVLVNPRGGAAFGRRLVAPELAAGADVAVAVTPASSAPSIAEACGRLEIPLLVVESAGFTEAGARSLEDDLRESAARAGVRVIGPNCLGFFAARSCLNLTTLPPLPAGEVSFVSQSGGLALQVASRLRELGCGFDVMLSLGNKLDVGFGDALELLARRAETRAILLYVERLDEGDGLLDRVQEAADSVPIIALLGGRTEVGRSAARSHTGSMLGRYERAAALLSDAGAFVLDSLALATAAACAGSAIRADVRRAFAVVDGGGHSVLLADALASAGIELTAPPHELAQALAAEGHRPSNPLDLAGAADSDPQVYARVLAAVLASGAYDGVVLGGIFGGYEELFGDHLRDAELAAAQEISRLTAGHDVRVVLQSTYAKRGGEALSAARAGGVPCVEWPEEAVAALMAASGRVLTEHPSLLAHTPDRVPRRGGEQPPLGDGELCEWTERALAAFGAVGLRHGLGELVGLDGLPTQGGPWVLRLDGFTHKARVGAIRLGLTDADLPAAYRELCALAREHGLEPRVRVAPMLAVEEELVVSLWRDTAQGSGWMIGAGGAELEQVADVAVGRSPRSEDDVRRLLDATQLGRRLLESGRAGPVFELACSLSRAFQALPEIRELECNPVGLTADGPVILDVVVTA